MEDSHIHTLRGINTWRLWLVVTHCSSVRVEIKQPVSVPSVHYLSVASFVLHTVVIEFFRSFFFKFTRKKKNHTKNE